MNLSKSLYTRGIQCPKSLWLKKYKPQKLTPPNELSQSIFETGNIVGELACKLFKNGKEVPYTTNFDEMISLTQKYLNDKVSAIYEATFNYDGILVLVDILKVEEDGISIFEVKSSTQVKDIYLHDASIQYYVLKNLGYTIKSVHIVHINSSYVRGENLDIEELFVINDVSDDVVELQKNILKTLNKFKNVLDDKINEPSIEIGKHCNKPYECDAKNYCWRVQRKIPDYSIFNIFNLGSKKQEELYNKGIINIDDIPDDFPMTNNQKRAVINYKTKKDFIDKEKIQEFCSSLKYPIYHLDFETYQQAIPKFEGITPFGQIPFQYSLHIEYEDGRLEHKEFLAKEGIDPREELVKKLCRDIPKDVMILAYNMSFEKSVLTKLSYAFPEYKEHLESISTNMNDLMIPFQKAWYSSPSMKGSYSIKYVLPALVPDFSQAYKDLDGVQNGADAMNIYANLENMNDEEKERFRTSLLQYCKLDTLAMVKILEVLKKI